MLGSEKRQLVTVEFVIILSTTFILPDQKIEHVIWKFLSVRIFTFFFIIIGS